MLNDVKIPPKMDELIDPAHTPKEPGVRPHPHIKPHVDPNEPGLHKSRVMGEPTRIDPIYAMPMEDRGSFFSLMLSAVVVLVVGIVLLTLWLSLGR